MKADVKPLLLVYNCLSEWVGQEGSTSERTEHGYEEGVGNGGIGAAYA